jgi:hypothetical protein
VLSIQTTSLDVAILVTSTGVRPAARVICGHVRRGSAEPHRPWRPCLPRFRGTEPVLSARDWLPPAASSHGKECDEEWPPRLAASRLSAESTRPANDRHGPAMSYFIVLLEMRNLWGAGSISPSESSGAYRPNDVARWLARRHRGLATSGSGGRPALLADRPSTFRHYSSSKSSASSDPSGSAAFGRGEMIVPNE